MRPRDLSGYAAVGATCCVMMCGCKVDPNVTHNGSTPLHYAVSETFDYDKDSCYCYTDSCKRSMVSYLLAKGAKTTAQTDDGKTPYEVMEERFVKDEDRKILREGYENVMHLRRLEEVRRPRE